MAAEQGSIFEGLLFGLLPRSVPFSKSIRTAHVPEAPLVHRFLCSASPRFCLTGGKKPFDRSMGSFGPGNCDQTVQTPRVLDRLSSVSLSASGFRGFAVFLFSDLFLRHGFPFNPSQPKRVPFFSHGHWASELSCCSAKRLSLRRDTLQTCHCDIEYMLKKIQFSSVHSWNTWQGAP